MNGGMSAIGTKRTYACVLQMSAFEGKADMVAALRESVFEPKADMALGVLSCRKAQGCEVSPDHDIAGKASYLVRPFYSQLPSVRRQGTFR